MVRSTIRRTLCVVGAVAALTTFRRRSAQCADILPRERELIRFVIQFFINSRVFLKQILKHFRLKRATLLIRSSVCLAVVGEVPPSAHHGHWPSSPLEGGQPQVSQWFPRRHAAQAEAERCRRPFHRRRHQVKTTTSRDDKSCVARASDPRTRHPPLVAVLLERFHFDRAVMKRRSLISTRGYVKFRCLNSDV